MARSGESSLGSYTLSVLRIVAGFTFSCHGMQKLFGLFGGMGGGGAKAHFFSLPWAAGFLEALGGLLILLGLFTARVAFILCGEMAVAYFKQHFPHGPIPIRNGGELAVIYCFLFLHLTFSGGGAFSLDALRRKRT